MTLVQRIKALTPAPIKRVLRPMLRRRITVETRPAGDVFDVWALDGRDMGMEEAHGPIARRLFQSLSLPEDAWYLDLGCGNGYTVRWAAARLPRGRAVGIDVSPQMIARARELSATHRHVDFYQTAFPRHTLPYAAFDAILSMETLYYLPDLPAALAEIWRLLKPGGIFVSAIDFYRENRESHEWPWYVGARMELLSERRWRQAFERAGFTTVSQQRLVIPADEAVESWHTTIGSLVTSGRRPHGS